MALPGRRQTFAMETCRDLHAKLEWEIEALREAALGSAPEPLIYHAFNCAVTAWQITDWAWLDMTLEQQARLGTAASGKTGIAGFQEVCREQCRALHLCRQIATASKHGVVTKHTDPSVDASVVAEVLPFQITPLGAEVRTLWRVMIHDGNLVLDATGVFEQALYFWDHLIYREKLGAD